MQHDQSIYLEFSFETVGKYHVFNLLDADLIQATTDAPFEPAGTHLTPVDNQYDS